MPRRRRSRTSRNTNTTEQPQPRAIAPVAVREKLEKSWERYQSIKQHTDEETVELIRENGHADDHIEWVVTEKIHGANFGLCTNGKYVVATKRTSLLQDDNSQFFRGWKDVLDLHQRQALKIFQHVRSKFNQDVQVITIFGELFGGYYEHPDIEVPSTVQQVQFGLSYSPNLHFCAFDIKVDETFLDYNASHRICERFGLMFAEPIFRGTFERCMEFDVETFETLIPERLQLPPPVTRHGEPNIGEGVVLRRAEGGHVLVKKKAQKFWEFSTKRGVENARAKKWVIELIGEECVDFLRRCCTEARFDAAVSKIGEVTPENTEEIVEEFSEDVWRDTVDRYSVLNDLDKEHRDRVREYADEQAQRYAKCCVKRRRRRVNEQKE